MARRSDHSREELRELALKAAREIIETDGRSSVTIRSVATRMGYTSGTLYQVFDNLDALIFEANIGILQDLCEAAQRVDFSRAPRDVLLDLAMVYFRFAMDRRNALASVFEHHSGRRNKAPQEYENVVIELIGFGAQAIAPIVRDQQHRIVEARVLWSALYGIVGLALADNQSQMVETEDLLESLVRTYVAGLEARYG